MNFIDEQTENDFIYELSVRHRKIYFNLKQAIQLDAHNSTLREAMQACDGQSQDVDKIVAKMCRINFTSLITPQPQPTQEKEK